MSDEIRALKFAGGVDADGHILKTRTSGKNYLEAKYQPKALRLKRDRAGLEYMEIEGRPSKFLSGGMFAGLSRWVKRSRWAQLRPTTAEWRRRARWIRRSASSASSRKTSRPRFCIPR